MKRAGIFQIKCTLAIIRHTEIERWVFIQHSFDGSAKFNGQYWFETRRANKICLLYIAYIRIEWCGAMWCNEIHEISYLHPHIIAYISFSVSSYVINKHKPNEIDSCRERVRATEMSTDTHMISAQHLEW